MAADRAPFVDQSQSMNLFFDKPDYKRLTSLSAEAREKFSKIKPRTIGQASRISGITPSDISVLMVYLGR